MIHGVHRMVSHRMFFLFGSQHTWYLSSSVAFVIYVTNSPSSTSLGTRLLMMFFLSEKHAPSASWQSRACLRIHAVLSDSQALCAQSTYFGQGISCHVLLLKCESVVRSEFPLACTECVWVLEHAVEGSCSVVSSSQKPMIPFFLAK